MSRWPFPRRVEVEWRDTCTFGPWDTQAVHREHQRDGLVRSIGYVLDANDEVVHLMQTQCAATSEVADGIMIPRASIVTMRKLTGGLSPHRKATTHG